MDTVPRVDLQSGGAGVILSPGDAERGCIAARLIPGRDMHRQGTQASSCIVRQLFIVLGDLFPLFCFPLPAERKRVRFWTRLLFLFFFFSEHSRAAGARWQEGSKWRTSRRRVFRGHCARAHRRRTWPQGASGQAKKKNKRPPRTVGDDAPSSPPT
ncbi:unnamed protein product [Discosporangium mesarthrocarpum]